ncbi:hypothetical protein HS048_20500 [Planomonospora sp. ID91781]|uniref:hypothetical protein n=1 Tax=Planomonospora TaxID=1998 RepID=UPI000839FD47|nr:MULTISPECIES: hypothetical protein [Planomonospora]MBG0823119.1 hypothetical protein [Planomonospora sp. ID91781]
MRSHPREFCPAALQAFDDLTARDALAVPAKVPTPQAGRARAASRPFPGLRMMSWRRSSAGAKVQVP